MDVIPEGKEDNETLPEKATENISARGIASMQGLEEKPAVEAAEKLPAGNPVEVPKPNVDTPAEPVTPPAPTINPPPEYQPKPILGENFEKGTGDGFETGVEKTDREFIPGYTSGGLERGG